MFDNAALTLMSQPQIVVFAYGLGVFLAGFFLALCVHRRSTWTLRRVSYFVAFAGVFALQSIFSLGWLATFSAIEHGFYWLLVAMIFLGVMGTGYLDGVISRARSLDGYGNGGKAWLAVVPIANLFLWFKAPIENNGPTGAARVAGNAAGIVLGLALLVLGQIITNASDSAFELMAELSEAETDLKLSSSEAPAQTYVPASQRSGSDSARPTTQPEVIQIKGMHSGMNLDEALVSINRKGGTCSSHETKDLNGNAVVFTSCKIQDGTRQSSWDQTDISLYSERTRGGLVLKNITFDCAYTNTCGMERSEVTDALRSAGVLSSNSDSRLVSVGFDGDIWLHIPDTAKPNFN